MSYVKTNPLNLLLWLPFEIENTSDSITSALNSPAIEQSYSDLKNLQPLPVFLGPMTDSQTNRHKGLNFNTFHTFRVIHKRRWRYMHAYTNSWTWRKFTHPILTSVFKLCSGFAKDNYRIFSMACPMSNSQKNVQDRFLKHSIFF